MANKFARTKMTADKLLLDLENPRFGLDVAESQDDALEVLVRNANLKELWDSINSQGWINFEPLVALSKKKTGCRVVIEGNRRVAALQTLLNPERLPTALAKRVPPISLLAKGSIDELDVLLVDNRHEADAFIGFKHVNGPATWGSLAKAKFADSMFQRSLASKKSPAKALSAVQDALGDTSSSSIARMLMAYKVFTQAVDNNHLSDRLLEEGLTGFSHLYTMMPNPASREFIGLGSAAITADSLKANPVPKEYLENLNYLVGWLFGNEKAKKIIKAQGTDRPRLQKVLAEPAARKVLIATGDLTDAAAEIGLDVSDWRDRMIKLEKLAKDLSTDLFDVLDDMEADELKDAKKRARTTEKACNSIVISLNAQRDDIEDLLEQRK
jgi:hypothetical protein